MKKELDEKLCKEFPLLYRLRRGKPHETSMCWGFSVDDGWFDLIYDLSVKIEKIIVGIKAENLDTDLPYASQVKEKFGGLRFYMNSATKDIYDLISKAEADSYTICESCGKPGTTKRGSWINTLCDEHHEEEQKRLRGDCP